MNLHSLSRRDLLRLSGLSGLGLLLNSCRVDELTKKIGSATEPLNQRVEELLLNPQGLAPEYPLSAIEPQALRVNSFNPEIPIYEPDDFELTINGRVQKPLTLTMDDIQKMPMQSMVIRHVCVEGWAAIVQWGGVRLRDLIALAQPLDTVRYVYFESDDGYYNSWDLPSAQHPQTLLAYQMNGKPLPEDNGAPLRLAAPIKLGYKQSKWVSKITLLDRLTDKQGYWEDQGYEWFGGL